MASKSSPAFGCSNSCNALDSFAFNFDGMREIKFRAWDGSKMVVPACICEYGKWYETGRDYENGIGKKEGLMQSTGLKDKNGTTIFEGDFIRFYDKTVAIIVFEPFGGWCFKWIDQTYKNVRQQNPEPIFRNINLFEVVGNIHENPELL